MLANRSLIAFAYCALTACGWRHQKRRVDDPSQMNKPMRSLSSVLLSSVAPRAHLRSPRLSHGHALGPTQATTPSASFRDRRSDVRMQERKRNYEAKTFTQEQIKSEKPWDVLLHNDDVHTFEYVNDAITSVVPTISKAKAHDICIQVHTTGIGKVTSTWKQKAKVYCMSLQRSGLTVSIKQAGKGKGDSPDGDDGGYDGD
mmetsp:Transcript_113514/g.177522  ORF Transcript_113514/g.177522 Transcript_113514/m.177522 type:complete len:201 (+) Transcript_113514:58-660(+)